MLSITICYVLFFAYLIGFLLWLTSRKYRHYPGLGMPILGDLYQTFTSYSPSLRELTESFRDGIERYGDTYCRRFGPGVIIVTADPNLIEKLASHPSMANKEPYVYKNFSPLMKGVFTITSSDAEWKTQRKMFVASMSKTLLRSYHDVFVQRSQELIDFMARKNGEFNLRPPVTLMALDAVCETLAGFSYGYLKNENYQCFEEFERLNREIPSRLLSLGVRRLDMEYGKSFKNIWNCLEVILNDTMESLKSEKEGLEETFGYKPYIENLIRDRLENGLLPVQILPYVIEMINEPFYVTALNLSDALFFLGLHPEYQEKAWQEQEQIYGDSLEGTKFEDLNKMEYLDRVIKEVVRLTSPVGFPRRRRGDIKIDGHFIPKDSVVLYFNEYLRKDPRYWKNPNQFDPDNFLPEEVAKRPKYAFMGFGIGLRNCPGIQYGTNFSKVVLSMVLRNYRIITQVRPDEVSFRPCIFMYNRCKYMITVEPRHR